MKEKWEEASWRNSQGEGDAKKSIGHEIAIAKIKALDYQGLLDAILDELLSRVAPDVSTACARYLVSGTLDRRAAHEVARTRAASERD